MTKLNYGKKDIRFEILKGLCSVKDKAQIGVAQLFLYGLQINEEQPVLIFFSRNILIEIVKAIIVYRVFLKDLGQFIITLFEILQQSFTILLASKGLGEWDRIEIQFER